MKPFCITSYGLGLLLSTQVLFAQDTLKLDLESDRKDCQMEGEAGCMSGDALMLYIEECLKELHDYSYANTQ